MKKVEFVALFVTPYSHTVVNGYGISISKKTAIILIKEALKKFEGEAKFFWGKLESTDEESNVVITYSSKMIVANPEGGGTYIVENEEIGPVKKS